MPNPSTRTILRHILSPDPTGASLSIHPTQRRMVADIRMNKPRPIIGRVGGKARLAPWVIQHLTRFQWSIYCEPFCGSAAVYFRMIQDLVFQQIRDRGHHPRIVLNDADSRIVQLFRTCRDHPELLAYAVSMTPYSREEHRLAQQGIDGIEDEVEQARRFLVGMHQTISTDEGFASRWSQTRNQHDPRDRVDTWHTLPRRILNATDHLKRCYIENDDAVKCIERWATPHTCFYLDPPYVDCENYYAHNAKAGKDSNLELHHRLAAAANTVEAAAVVVSYYPCELVDELYPEDRWEYHYKDTVASSAGITRNSKTKTRPKRTELLLVRKAQGTAPAVNLSGQISLF